MTKETEKATPTESSEQTCARFYCPCVHPICCKKCGEPLKNRDETIRVFEHDLVEANNRTGLADVHGNGALVLSNIPESSKPSADGASSTKDEDDDDGIVLGIDEAGRGSVLGPMTYGMAFWHTSQIEHIPKGFQDSKALSEDKRNTLFDQLLHNDDIGFGLRVFWPSEISRNMLRTDPYNLNQMSHDAAMCLIRKVVDAGVKLKTCYIDTVGDPRSYRRKLEQQFSGIKFVVESKADANYAPCSAASVVAKVMRDRLMDQWTFSEPGLQDSTSREFGSGYPSDPKCKKWMADIQDPVFGYSNLLRFSWAPAKALVLENGVPVVFQADIDEDELEQQKGMMAFMGSAKAGGTKRKKRSPFFEKRKLQSVAKITAK